MKAIINRNSMGVYVGGSIRTVTNDHPNFYKIKDLLKNEVNEDSILSLLDLKSDFKKDGIEEKDGKIFLYGEELNNLLTKRVLQLRSEGFKTENLLRFIENLHENPSKRAVDELYTFLEHFALPITEDGCFLAYKAVTHNYLDIWSETVDNKIGSKPEMKRNKVDENKNVACSSGYHVGAINYVKSYGHLNDLRKTDFDNRIMIVKVNPKDAVSVPVDSSYQKLRVCKYEVVEELKDYSVLLEKALYTSDAKEVQPSNHVPHENHVVEDDSLYFEGRRDGELDREAGIPYTVPDSDSPKYIQGYNNGYHR